MKELSDYELRKVFQEKLGNLDGEVSADSEERALAAIQQGSPVATGVSRNVGYGVLALLLLSPVVYYSLLEPKTFNATHQPEGQSPVAASSVSVPSEEKMPAAKAQPGLIGSVPDQQANRVLPAYEGSKHMATRNADQGAISHVTEYKSEPQAELSATPVPRMRDGNVTVDSLLADKPEMAATAKDSTTKENETVAPTKKTWLSLSVQPFLNYKNVRPNTDGIFVSHFDFPNTISSERLGVKVSAALDFELASNKFLSAGFSWFSYRSTFSYQANEIANGIQLVNSVDETIQGFALNLGGKYPLKVAPGRKQFVSGGVDFHQIIGTQYPQGTQVMINIGYANHWPMGKGEFRLTPVFSYSITRISYPGVAVQPYWAGVEMGYSIPFKR